MRKAIYVGNKCHTSRGSVVSVGDAIPAEKTGIEFEMADGLCTSFLAFLLYSCITTTNVMS